MDRIQAQVNEVIIVLFNIDPNIPPDRLNADFIAAWDSLGHLNLIAKIEQVFSIKIPIRESVRLLSAEAIAKLVMVKTKSS
jgi:acyl carrier protein